MKPLRWTPHAADALIDRAIDRAEVERTLTDPELSVLDPPMRVVHMRPYLDRRLGKPMLIRVVVEETPHERVIGTVSKTSQLAKDLGRTRA